MNTFGSVLGAAVVVYVGVCFGRIAAKHGKNPLLYGFLSILSPINLFILGCWAFSDADRGAAKQQRRERPTIPRT